MAGAFGVTFATTGSKYTGQIDACIKANKDGKAKTIEDYVCPVGVLKPQQIAFQVIMSIEFKKLDDQVKKDLQAIHEWSNKDVWQLATNIGDLFDSSKGDTAKYPNKYAEICNIVTMKETALYFEEKWESSKTNDSVTTDNDAKDFLFWQKGCQDLVKTKLQADKEAAWLLGESAIVKSFKKDKHDYMRKLKDHYEKFLNKWTIFIGQLATIKDKWPSKTKKVW